MATSKYNKSEALKESWKRDYQNDIKVAVKRAVNMSRL